MHQNFASIFLAIFYKFFRLTRLCACPSQCCGKHLEKVRDFYNSAGVDSGWAGRQYRKLLAHYYKLLIPADASVIEIGCGSGELLELFPNRKIAGVDMSERQIERARQRIPHGVFYTQAAEFLDIEETFDFIIVSETINLAADAQAILERLQSISHAGTRLIVNYHNNLWRPILELAAWLGLQAPSVEANWFSTKDVRNLLLLSDWEELKLRQPVKDTLCGTKALFRRDYQRIAANRHYFGDFDPFGDFDLLFGADKLHLKIVDVPIRYRKRTYGRTNIQRWLHGVILFKMVAFAARKLKFI